MRYNVTNLATTRVPFTGLPVDYYPAQLGLFDVDGTDDVPVWSVTLVGPCVLLVPDFASIGITVRAVAVWPDGSVSEEVLLPEP